MLITWGGCDYCAPVSKALLTRSACVVLRRTSGETPMEAMAAVALCIASSLMYPCSQSIMMPCKHFSVTYNESTIIYTHVKTSLCDDLCSAERWQP
jgi:hypothetical protein